MEKPQDEEDRQKRLTLDEILKQDQGKAQAPVDSHVSTNLQGACRREFSSHSMPLRVTITPPSEPSPMCLLGI